MNRSRLSVAAIALIAAGCASAVPAATAAPIAKTQVLAGLTEAKMARALPAVGARHVARVPAWRPITGGRTVLPVVGHVTDARGVAWLRVRLPGRPNGRTAWITARATVRSSTDWHLVVHTATRRITAFRDGRAVRSFPAVVGKPSTPTPHGEFFVEESLRMAAGEPGAPYALALSARSEVLQEFAGGPGQIAVHGLRNIGGVPGTAASHGCVRLGLRALTWVIKRLGPGTPVTIKDA